MTPPVIGLRLFAFVVFLVLAPLVWSQPQPPDLSEYKTVENAITAKLIKGKKETPLLHEGNEHLSPLLHPRPHNSEPSKKRAGAKAEQPQNTPEPSPAGQIDLEEIKRLMEK